MFAQFLCFLVVIGAVFIFGAGLIGYGLGLLSGLEFFAAAGSAVFCGGRAAFHIE